jgi:epoxide hydrolase 4
MLKTLVDEAWAELKASFVPRSRILTVNSTLPVEIHFVEAGERGRPTVVLVHGVPQFWFTWRRQIVSLAEAGFHVIAPDMPGYNQSGRPRELQYYSLEALAADVGDLIASTATDGRAVLVGHDFGGIISYATAMFQPERLHKLLVFDSPHPLLFRRFLIDQRNAAQFHESSYAFQFAYAGGLSDAFIRLAGVDRSLKLLTFRKSFLNDRAPREPSVFTDREIKIYALALEQDGALRCMMRYYQALFEQYLRSPSSSTALLLESCLPPWMAGWFPCHAGKAPALPLIEVPTTIVFGSEDGYLDHRLFADRANLQLLIPGLESVHIVEGASHWLPEERPEVVTREIIQMLK